MASLGVLGGSFDPVHFAHLVVAERVREALGLDRVLFVPAARQPLKAHGPVAAGAARLEMLRLAIAGNPGFVASAAELERGGTSYTVETLEELAREEPERRLFLILGSDAYALVERWRRFADVQRLARLVVVPRAGAPAPSSGPDVQTVQVPALAISASDIRARVARGASIRCLVPDSVRAFILDRGLYRS